MVDLDEVADVPVVVEGLLFGGDGVPKTRDPAHARPGHHVILVGLGRYTFLS